LTPPRPTLPSPTRLKRAPLQPRENWRTYASCPPVTFAFQLIILVLVSNFSVSPAPLTDLYVVRFISVHPEPKFRSSQNLKALVREASSRNLVSWMMAMLMRMLFSAYFTVSLKSKPAFILPASFTYMVSNSMVLVCMCKIWW
jgi:hypothetical protein